MQNKIITFIAPRKIITLKIIELRLKADGHEVTVAHDGREALKKLEESSFDLVITDMNMPFISGMEIIVEIRKDKLKNIPVIVLSSMGQENMVLQAFRLGADDYITKPFNAEELALRVKRYAQRS